MVATVPAGFAPRAGEVTAVTNWPAARFCWRLTFIGIASLGLLLPFIAPRRAVGQIKSNLSSSVTSESMTHVWVARDRGLFKKYGLDMQFILMPRNTLAIAALLAGVTLPQNMLVTTRRTAATKPAVIEGYLKATIEAIAMISDPANKELVSRLLASNLRLSNPADVEESYQAVIANYEHAPHTTL